MTRPKIAKCAKKETHTHRIRHTETNKFPSTWCVPKVSVLIFYLIIYWTYLKLQVISFEV